MNIVNRLGVGILVALVACVAPASTWAQEKKPAVVVSIASLDKVLGDVGYLTRAAGMPEAGGVVTLMAGPYLQGLDTKRPAGLFLQFAGPQPTGVAFLPVKDLDQVLQSLENNNIEVEDGDGGLRKINLQRPIFLKEKGGWAFISDNDANLENLPADPSKLLAGLSDKYNLAVQLNVRSIPEELIDMAVSEMKNGFERNLENETDEDKKALQEKVGRKQIENFTRLLQESDQLTLGWGVDSKAGKVFLDFGLTAVADSRLAKQMDGYSKLTSTVGGIELADAAATMRFTIPLDEDDIEQVQETLEAARDQALKGIDEDSKLKDGDAKEVAKDVVTAIFDVLIDTADEGKFDGGLAVSLDPKAVHVVAGGFVADGEEIQDQLKELAKLAEESGDDDVSLEDLKFNAAKHKGVDLHTFSVPVPDDEEQAQQLFGKSLDVVVGTGEQSAYVALGKESTDLLKKVLDDSASASQKTVIPFSLNVSLAPILGFAASVDDDEMVKLLAKTIQEAAGKDHIRVTQRGVARGTSVRLEVEEGVLRLIGAAAHAQNNRNN